jgi:RimJ/RimL family protein N-acetyltransferase
VADIQMLVPTITTERLRLRAYELGDAAELTQLIGARAVAANLLRVPYPYSEQDARAFICASEQSGEARFAVALAGQERLIGGIGLKIQPRHARAELGYWLGIPYWGRGYATEAARVVIEYGFNTWQLDRIHAWVFRENLRSAKVLRKIGMRHEGCFRQHVLKGNRFVGLELYGIMRAVEIASRTRSLEIPDQLINTSTRLFP